MTDTTELRALLEEVEARALRWKANVKDASRGGGKEARHKIYLFTSRMSEADEIVSLIRARIAALETTSGQTA